MPEASLTCARCSVPVPAGKLAARNRCLDPRCPLAPAAGHTVAMTLDHKGEISQSVATCACGGFVNRVDWLPGCYELHDLAIYAHWQDVRGDGR